MAQAADAIAMNKACERSFDDASPPQGRLIGEG